MVRSCHRAGGGGGSRHSPEAPPSMFLLLSAPFSFWARKTAGQALPEPPPEQVALSSRLPWAPPPLRGPSVPRINHTPFLEAGQSTLRGPRWACKQKGSCHRAMGSGQPRPMASGPARLRPSRCTHYGGKSPPGVGEVPEWPRARGRPVVTLPWPRIPLATCPPGHGTRARPSSSRAVLCVSQARLAYSIASVTLS